MSTTTTNLSLSYIIRPHRASDIPQILSGHRTEYVTKGGWNTYFMSLVSSILTGFLENNDPELERFWVAERTSDSEFLGCVMLIQKPAEPSPETKHIEEKTHTTKNPLNPETAKTARLRVLFVSPEARGLGLGRVLVRLATDFAREKEYASVQLSSSEFQGAAMRIYEKEGYRLVSEEVNQVFGPRLRQVVLELDLREGMAEGEGKEGNVVEKKIEGKAVYREIRNMEI
ncbi:hypothetical protein W97_02352 [Coniosporium apollinis CBS 100218]|uniref:N-acetyltransferase domain-containing protein n=1 Tax=Coniosporium apollinis (strain CBS 100218) TaxID=1168221 RepID=R7YMI5_CONA1|nr:uncharacterized protein W97_02352 [Coniosporium apollinis CBS 100218]EON63125.1 hypothetical protein W97_02352 [Coniosporium apollinis CBS 100218]